MAWIQTSLLHHVQMAGLHRDSKHFVDMPLKTSVAAVMADWSKLEGREGSRAELERLVSEHFAEPGSDVEECHQALEGWEEQGPAFLAQVAPAELAAVGREVYQLWRVLHRSVTPQAKARPELHTLLPLPNPFVIPGDRFREVYYWDSYWILCGLLACGLRSTALGMLGNMLHLVDLFGFVPNGARTYYLNRSQPPMLSSMVAICAAASTEPGSSSQLLEQALPRLLQSWSYWTSGSKAVQLRGKSGRVFQLSRYWADWEQPRPESYREDLELAAGLDEAAARQLYRDVASAAESGWDFSSRWLRENDKLSTIRTTEVVPADLNALLHLTAQHIASFARQLGDHATSELFSGRAAQIRDAMDELMWSEMTGCWRDLLLLKAEEHTDSPDQEPGQEEEASTSGRGDVWRTEQQTGMYASNWVPLWCGCCTPRGAQANAAVASLRNSGLIGEAGVVMTSTCRTGQQWDAPNAWAPLQHMLIEGLRLTELEEGAALASELASAWIEANFVGYQATGHMHEKYDGMQRGGAGGGGEYVPQVGFGWSNGVLLELLRTYPDQAAALNKRPDGRSL